MLPKPRFAAATVRGPDSADDPSRVGHTRAATPRTALSCAARSLGVSGTPEGIGSITDRNPYTGRFSETNLSDRQVGNRAAFGRSAPCHRIRHDPGDSADMPIWRVGGGEVVRRSGLAFGASPSTSVCMSWCERGGCDGELFGDDAGVEAIVPHGDEQVGRSYSERAGEVHGVGAA